MLTTTIAKPYAKAAFEFAETHQCVKKWYQALQSLATVIKNDQIANLLKNPLIEPNSLFEVLSDLLSDQWDDAIKNFVILLTENKRLALLPDILLAFHEAKNDSEQILDVAIETAYPLETSQEERLKEALKTRFKKHIHLNVQENPNLLGGAIIRTKQLVFDGSCKTKLEQLKKFMVN